MHSIQPYVSFEHYSRDLQRSQTTELTKINPAIEVEKLNLENLPGFVFPVYNERRIFVTRLRSGDKFLRNFTMKQEMDFDVDSSDEMIKDAIFLGVKGMTSCLLEEQEIDYQDVLDGKKGFFRRRTLKKFIQDYEIWNEDLTE